MHIEFPAEEVRTMNDVSSRLGGYTMSFGLNEYFQKSLMPLDIRGYMRSISKPTPHMQDEHNLLFLVRSGKGRIDINNEHIRLKRGAFICLGPFHNYTITPDDGSTLELDCCRVDASAHMYILSCPYVKISEFVIPQPAACAIISNADTLRAERIFASLREDMGTDYYSEKMRFLYLMELMGIMLSKTDPSRLKNRYDPRLLEK